MRANPTALVPTVTAQGSDRCPYHPSCPQVALIKRLVQINGSYSAASHLRVGKISTLDLDLEGHAVPQYRRVIPCLPIQLQFEIENASGFILCNLTCDT